MNQHTPAPERTFHPAAEIFPLLPDDELAALAADIETNGLREAIWLDDQGQIIDGRNRYRACQRVGIEPAFRTWEGEGTVLTFVVSMNLHRRHLNESQRAMIAAKLAKLEKGQRADYVQPENQDQLISGPAITQTEAARLLNVGTTTVGAARKVLREGTPEEIEAVSRGEAHVQSLAKEISKKTPPEKRRGKRTEPISDKGKNPERIENLRIQGQIWTQIKDSLDQLTNLPLPADVVAVVRANTNRAGYVDAHLAQAFNWLKEFHNEWTKEAAN